MREQLEKLLEQYKERLKSLDVGYYDTCDHEYNRQEGKVMELQDVINDIQKILKEL